MVRKLLFYYLIYITLFVVSGCSTPYSPVQTKTDTTPPTLRQIDDPLVSVDWLKQRLDDPNLVILDATVQIDFDERSQMSISSGRKGYLAGHIPNAGFADLTNDLVDNQRVYPYAIPTPEKFATAMEALGVGDDSLVVLYARDYTAWAARVWWMLRWIGFDNAVVLDGGLTAWKAAGLPITTEAVDRPAASLTIKLRPSLIVERDEVYAAINDPNVLLIDAMPAAHFRGEMQMYARTGHIPTAINVPTVFAEDGRFLSKDLLVQSHPFDPMKRAITYCGGGISASANAFAMHRLGFSDVGVYMNSLEEWAADERNPMVVPGK